MEGPARGVGGRCRLNEFFFSVLREREKEKERVDGRRDENGFLSF